MSEHSPKLCICGELLEEKTWPDTHYNHTQINGCILEGTIVLVEQIPKWNELMSVPDLLAENKRLREAALRFYMAVKDAEPEIEDVSKVAEVMNAGNGLLAALKGYQND